MAQISLTLPDNSIRKYEAGVTAAGVAADIASSLAKKAISATVGGKHFDLAWPIEVDSTIAIHTIKDELQADELIRHDLAHVMACAVQEIWPDVQVTIGPVIKDGWYYDFDRKESFTHEDLTVIEKKMKDIINRRDPVRTEIWDRTRAVQHYIDAGEPYKVELISSIPGDEPLRSTTCRCLQTDERCRSLLARRQQAHNVTTHLRCGLYQQRKTKGPFTYAGGGRKARPPQAGS